MLLSPYRLGKPSSKRLNNLPKVTCGRRGIWTQVCLIITYCSSLPIKNNLLLLVSLHSNPYAHSQRINLLKHHFPLIYPTTPFLKCSWIFSCSSLAWAHYSWDSRPPINCYILPFQLYLLLSQMNHVFPAQLIPRAHITSSFVTFIHSFVHPPRRWSTTITLCGGECYMEWHRINGQPPATREWPCSLRGGQDYLPLW